MGCSPHWLAKAELLGWCNDDWLRRIRTMSASDAAPSGRSSLRMAFSLTPKRRAISRLERPSDLRQFIRPVRVVERRQRRRRHRHRNIAPLPPTPAPRSLLTPTFTATNRWAATKPVSATPPSSSAASPSLGTAATTTRSMGRLPAHQWAPRASHGPQ